MDWWWMAWIYFPCFAVWSTYFVLFTFEKPPFSRRLRYFTRFHAGFFVVATSAGIGVGCSTSPGTGITAALFFYFVLSCTGIAKICEVLPCADPTVGRCAGDEKAFTTAALTPMTTPGS
eukprot:Hpha_TRINITY_DN15575_c2_g8::TRINITY_DN15575_c2_g8_i2::g.105677::m.105677